MRLVVTAARADTLAERWLSETWTPEPPVADQWRDVIFTDAGKPAAHAHRLAAVARRRRAQSRARR